jgi:hypothetical protein
MLLLFYPSKKDLKAAIGQTLKYEETSLFGAEFKPNGKVTGSNRPTITGVKGREFFAEVTMAGGLIAAVS